MKTYLYLYNLLQYLALLKGEKVMKTMKTFRSTSYYECRIHIELAINY